MSSMTPMLRVLVNIDVNHVERAVAFYTDALARVIGSRFGNNDVELLGAAVLIDLLAKPATRPPAPVPPPPAHMVGIGHRRPGRVRAEVRPRTSMGGRTMPAESAATVSSCVTRFSARPYMSAFALEADDVHWVWNQRNLVGHDGLLCIALRRDGHAQGPAFGTSASEWTMFRNVSWTGLCIRPSYARFVRPPRDGLIITRL
jgi:hypothetical protein